MFVTGSFIDTADFDPGPGAFGLTATSAPGHSAAFVLRLTTAGLFQGARGFAGNTQSSDSLTIAAGPTGVIWLGGQFAGTLVMDGFTLTNNSTGHASFVAKLNGLGAVVFAASFGPEADVRGVAVDAAGDAIFAGSFRGAVDLNPGPGSLVFSTATGYFEGFVLKLNPAGGFVWARRFASAPNGRTFAAKVAVDRGGNIYTTGLFTGTTDFDPGVTVFNLTSASQSHDVFVSRLDAAGAFLWAGRQGGPTYDDGRGVSTHGGCPGSPTRVHVTGGFSTTGDFNPTVGTAYLTSAGELDMFTAQLSFQNFALAQHLYVSTDLRVLRYDAWGPTLQTPTVFAPVPAVEPFRPRGLTFGPDCNLYVNNAGDNRVMRYRGTDGAQMPSAGNTGAGFVSSQSGGLGSPYGLKFGADARLYAASSAGASSGVLRYEGMTGASSANFTGANPPPSVLGVTFGGPAGDLYVTSGHDVLRYDRQSGALVASWNLAKDPLGNTHYDLTFGPGGDLYVTAFETNKVLRFDGVTGAPLADFVTAGSGGLSGPTGLAFGPDGRLYVISSGTKQILRYDGTTGAFVDVFASGGGLVLPTYLTFGP